MHYFYIYLLQRTKYDVLHQTLQAVPFSLVARFYGSALQKPTDCSSIDKESCVRCKIHSLEPRVYIIERDECID